LKYLVQTPGPFSLNDLMGEQNIKAHRPTVVTSTPFVESMLGRRLDKLEVLADDASDEALDEASTPEELEAAIAALPRRTKAKPAEPAPAHKPRGK
jgi:hypothetical protein